MKTENKQEVNLLEFFKFMSIFTFFIIIWWGLFRLDSYLFA